MIYLLEVRFHDGRRLHPVQIRRDEPDWQAQLDEAVAFFEDRYRGQAVVDVLYGRDLGSMGASEPEAVPRWRELPG